MGWNGGGGGIGGGIGEKSGTSKARVCVPLGAAISGARARYKRRIEMSGVTDSAHSLRWTKGPSQ